jgi:hypothetical protein
MISDNKFWSDGDPFFGDYIGIYSSHSLQYPMFMSVRSSNQIGCVPEVCISPFYTWNCVPNYTGDEMVTEDVQSGYIREWEVINKIEAGNKIEDGGVAVFNAGAGEDGGIDFLPDMNPNDPYDLGFWAKRRSSSRSYIHAYLEGCVGFSSNTESHKITNSKENLINFPVRDSDNKLSVFPNPTDGLFQVEFYNNEPCQYDIEIINSSGVKIFSMNCLEYPMVTIDITDQPKGVYLVSIISQGQIFSRKVILK